MPEQTLSLKWGISSGRITMPMGVVISRSNMLSQELSLIFKQPIQQFLVSRKEWPELAESITWAASAGRLEDLIVAIDGDDLALGVRAAGLYCKHRGNMAAARDFLCQSGAADLADGYATAVHRLSEGWLPL